MNEMGLHCLGNHFYYIIHTPHINNLRYQIMCFCCCTIHHTIFFIFYFNIWGRFLYILKNCLNVFFCVVFKDSRSNGWCFVRNELERLEVCFNWYSLSSKLRFCEFLLSCQRAASTILWPFVFNLAILTLAGQISGFICDNS